MRLGVRAKLFIASVGLVLAVVLASGIFLAAELRDLLENRIETELLRHAQSARAAVELAPQRDPERMDTLVARLGEASDARISVVGQEGYLLADSMVEFGRLAAAGDHRTRPEVVAALKQGRGRSRRYSTTVHTEMLYVAVPYHRSDGERGVVRAGRTLRSVDDAVDRLVGLLLLAGLFGLVVAVFMSGFASHMFSRTLRTLAESARAIVSGEAARRVDVTSRDELAGLAGSVNQMAEEIENTVAALASERALLKVVLEGMSDAVVALDSERRITLMNSAALLMLGLKTAPVGAPFVDTLRAPALQELLVHPDRDGETEIDLRGGKRRIYVRMSPLRDGAGCVLVMRDVTEIRRLETIRRDFVANVSHELRTPVSIIRANAETLLDGAREDPVHGPRLVEAVHRSAERLSNIISDLLDLSRLEAGRYRIHFEAVAVADAARRASESVERSARTRGTTVELEVSDDLMVSGDKKALEQVLINFLDNAVKYTPEGGHVWLRGDQRDKGTVRIEVRDDGPGIEARHRARIFERFYRVDPGRSRDMGGTGLGLSIVKHLMEAMNGRVGVDPAEPHGSVFWIELPLHRDGAATGEGGAPRSSMR